MSDLKVFPEIKEPDDSPHYPEKLRKTFMEYQEDVQMKRSTPRIAVGWRIVQRFHCKTYAMRKEIYYPG